MTDKEESTFKSSFRKVPDTFGIEECHQWTIAESKKVPPSEVLRINNKFRKLAGLPPLSASEDSK